ncbi:hypothetical protein G9A89_012524 [Geosiphon pyriformis]|nr:hypothetical protein G9A89_012524 [Geosiphon pyriformis]
MSQSHRKQVLLSYKANVDIFCEFLEVAIHFILYVRGVYPANLFVLRKKYDVPVHMSRHPHLTKYILELVLSCKAELEEGTLEKAALIIVNPNEGNKPIERWVFEVDKLVMFPDNLADARVEGAISLFDLEQHLRGFFRKISVSDAILTPNPEGCTFKFVMALKDGSKPASLENDCPWVPAEPSEKYRAIHHPKIVPIKSVDTGLFKLQLFVQQNQEKVEPSKDSSNIRQKQPLRD